MGRRRWAVRALALFPLLLPARSASAQEASPLQTPRDKVNYSIGVNIISNLARQGVTIDLDQVIRGMKDAHSGNKLLLSDEEIRIAIQRYQTDVRQKHARAKAKTATGSKAEGEEFLSRNRATPGVVSLPSGLQYRILRAGDGRRPADDSTVEVTYRGTLVDGTQFDTSPVTGKTASFALKGVIPGWREALKLMPAGSKWQIFVPSSLAYGERGKPGTVGPDAVLIYELELHAVK